MSSTINLTPEQLEALSRMGGGSGKELEANKQLALANQLRTSMASIKNGKTGGNIGRAAYGISSAMNDFQGQSKLAEYTKGLAGAAEQLATAEKLRRIPTLNPMDYDTGDM